MKERSIENIKNKTEVYKLYRFSHAVDMLCSCLEMLHIDYTIDYNKKADTYTLITRGILNENI